MFQTPISILEYLQKWGTITERQMFGGYSLFCDGARVAIYVKGTLYLRSGTDNALIFKRFGYKPYVQSKKNSIAVTKFYPVPKEWWKHRYLLDCEITKSVNQAKLDVLKKSQERLPKLPNINSKKAKLLFTSGVTSVEELYALGSVKAFLLVKNHYPNISDSFLFDIEGAISKQFSMLIPSDKKNRLLKEVHRHNVVNLERE